MHIKLHLHRSFFGQLLYGGSLYEVNMHIKLRLSCPALGQALEGSCPSYGQDVSAPPPPFLPWSIALWWFPIGGQYA